MSLDHLAVAVQGVGFRHESCAAQGFYTLEELIQSIIAHATTLSLSLTSHDASYAEFIQHIIASAAIIPLTFTGHDVSIEFTQNIAALASTLSMILSAHDVSRLRARGVNVLLRFFPNTVELRLRET